MTPSRDSPSRPAWLPFGLRWRLVLLVGLMSVAMAGMIGWTAADRYATAEAELAQNTVSLTRSAAHELERLFEGERHLLTTLAKVPALRNLDAPASRAFLTPLLQELPLYANFTVLAPDGEAIASAIPLTRPAMGTDLPWFRRAMQTRGFAVGEFEVGRISGKPVLVSAYPVLDAAGTVTAILTAALDLTKANAIIRPAQLPPGAAFMVIDRTGTLLARDPDPDRWVGRTLLDAESIRTILLERSGTAVVAGVDGVRRIYSFTPVAGSDDGIFVSIGIPQEAAFTGIRRAVIQELSSVGLIAGVGVLLVIVLAEVTVLRPARSLVTMSRRLAGGDLSARAGEPYGAGELEQLRFAFDQMAGALERREAERQGAMEELSRRHAELAATEGRLREALEAADSGRGALLNILEDQKQAKDALQGKEASLREANERLHALSRQLIDIQEVERRALAHELHDEIGQALTGIKIHVQAAQRFSTPDAIASQLARCVDLVDRALQSTRALALNLRPPMLDDLGLLPSLHWLADQQSQHTGLQVTVTANAPGDRFDPATETTCFRITQEALNNVVKHAGARVVSVSLTADARTLHVRVRDDGRGFDLAEARRRARAGASLGLLGMEERATLVGGGIEWQSAPGQGSEVHFWLPLTPG